MARYHRRRRKQRRTPSLISAAVAVIALGWWLYPREVSVTDEGTLTDRPVPPPLTSSRPDDEIVATAQPGVPERGANPLTPRGVDRKGDSAVGASGAGTVGETRVAALIESGKKALAADDLVAARSYFSEALALASDPAQRTALRAELTRLGNDTIFSARILPGDPLVERYVVQPGDSLGKIAKRYKVSADLLARINGLRNKNLIRAGQALKVIKGPFRAVVDADEYTMGLYLGDTFIRQFPVGLGEDGSTPHGAWQVATKLVNPTYYPPRGGRIIAADDPENPLGERWIGLHGVSGEAVGQLRYGIHGTNEPDSIGKSVSLGCIRMHNEDVEVVYDCLVENHSTVVVR